jgi:hypothetical protein
MLIGVQEGSLASNGEKRLVFGVTYGIIRMDGWRLNSSSETGTSFIKIKNFKISRLESFDTSDKLWQIFQRFFPIALQFLVLVFFKSFYKKLNARIVILLLETLLGF